MKRFSAGIGYSDRTWAPAAEVRVFLDETVIATNCFLGFYMATSDVDADEQMRLRSFLETMTQVIWLRNAGCG